MPSSFPEPSPSLANARDLASAAPDLVRIGMVYRSDAPLPGDEPPAGIDQWPPATVIDLRGDAEKTGEHTLAGSSRIVDLPVLDDAALSAQQARETLESLESLYSHMTQGESAAALVRGVSEVAQGQEPVLMHCSAGKDRTGLLAALVLGLVGADREAIVADYCATGPHMPGVIARTMRGVHADFREAALAQVPEEVWDAPAHAITSVLDRWDSDGGPEAWYLSHGGDGATLSLLRERLLVD